MNVNLHITMTSFENESRILKETTSLVKLGVVQQVYISALHKERLSEHFQINENIQVTRFKLYSKRWPKNLFFQIIKYLEYAFKIIFGYSGRNVSLVNVHCLALLPVGVALKYFYKAKLVYDTHELETEVDGNYGLRKFLCKISERLLLPFTDQIFVVSDSIASIYAKTYSIPSPPVLLNCPPYLEPVSNDYFRRHFGISPDAKIFLYQGGLSQGRGVHIILEAFKFINDQRSVVVFMGYGPMATEIQAAATQYNNIFYHPTVPSGSVLNYTSSADVGLHLIQNTCLNHYLCMPNKLFEYTMAGLPVIVSNMLEMSKFVESYQVGVVVSDLSAVSLADAINRIQSMDLSRMKNNALQAARLYNWEAQEKFLSVTYKQLLGDL